MLTQYLARAAAKVVHGGRGSGARQTTVQTPLSVLDFYVQSGMSESDFQQVEPFLINNAGGTGMINVNTATATALACIPGIGLNMAPQVLCLPAVQSAANALHHVAGDRVEQQSDRPRSGRPLRDALLLPICRRCRRRRAQWPRLSPGAVRF